MCFFARLRQALACLAQTGIPLPTSSPLLTGRDTETAIQGLSRAVSADPDAIEITLALGNLFRSQGDIARAVELREGLLARANLPPSFKARLFFELGCDYRRSGLLDRAQVAYKEARVLGYAEPAIQAELAELYAESGNFSAAAVAQAQLGNHRAEAYFLVRQAQEQSGAGNDEVASRLVKKALEVSPVSPEAWLTLTSMSALGGDEEQARRYLADALVQMEPSGRLIMLEGLYTVLRQQSSPAVGAILQNILAHTLANERAAAGPDALECYYCGLFFQENGDMATAESWYIKALALEPEFWATRLALLEIEGERHTLSPLFAEQILFFSKQRTTAKRFICSPCGMRRETVFSQCPRCHAWHSVEFRMYLN